MFLTQLFNKKNNLIGYLAIYILTMILFGLSYWLICIQSSGEAFIFQQDIALNYKINVIKKQLKLESTSPSYRNAIKDIISNGEYNRELTKLSLENNEDVLFSKDGVLGELWANYYMEVFKSKGITHYSIVTKQAERILGGTSAVRLEILYFKDCKNNNQPILLDSKVLWVDELRLADFSKEGNIHPINYYLFSILANSYSYIDNSPFIFKNIGEAKVKYPLLDFIYFSTVTITTLGYGDILPNSKIVRLLVIIETIAGVFIVAYMATAVFSKEEI